MFLTLHRQVFLFFFFRFRHLCVHSALTTLHAYKQHVKKRGEKTQWFHVHRVLILRNDGCFHIYIQHPRIWAVKLLKKASPSRRISADELLYRAQRWSSSSLSSSSFLAAEARLSPAGGRPPRAHQWYTKGTPSIMFPNVHQRRLHDFGIGCLCKKRATRFKRRTVGRSVITNIEGGFQRCARAPPPSPGFLTATFEIHFKWGWVPNHMSWQWLWVIVPTAETDHIL